MSVISGSIKAQKKALRNAVSSKLALLAPSTIEEQSQALTTRVLALPQFRHSNAVSCYLSMPTGEIITSPLVSEILASGKSLFVPKIQTKNGHMEFLKIYGAEDLASLPSGMWGIKEPGPQWREELRSNETLDIIFLPAVAFDRSLSRLGHGKGYYDRFITSYVASGKPKPLLIGFALRDQVFDRGQVPMDEHDWKMDLIITPDEMLGNVI
ncbi:5-formyltetrahydrofolate cyclo-ligase [Cyathus striatus]|nr:5-formyltetrahydrofolate cyclo-ligase [Cyathus striatus]